MTPITKLGLLYKLRRIALGLRQQDVARRIGITNSRYSGIERGDFRPTATELRLLEELLPPISFAPELPEPTQVQSAGGGI
jgi:transcriptional regulator with XRE-family HTH domain